MATGRWDVSEAHGDRWTVAFRDSDLAADKTLLAEQGRAISVSSDVSLQLPMRIKENLKHAAVENELRNKRDKDAIHSRIAQNELKQGDTSNRLAKLEKDVEALREAGGGGGVGPGGGDAAHGQSDPWLAYRAKHGPLPPKGHVGAPLPSGGEGRDSGASRDELSEEEERTLVLGGWDVRGLVDAQELTLSMVQEGDSARLYEQLLIAFNQ
ncbi:hypothetical protein AK812_SmicGene37772 [Symbiodinium microadriaticum]|uniref:Uncharacterized protein n=1 Tax=Symbiodinium microadriaticum TaxID=2951 RepID=A0A1Q9CFG2_SYMMI|nr:hypothetical protein AK812_SmicGene37772 [Symbiodinium microadriaticum]